MNWFSNTYLLSSSVISLFVLCNIQVMKIELTETEIEDCIPFISETLKIIIIYNIYIGPTNIFYVGFILYI